MSRSLTLAVGCLVGLGLIACEQAIDPIDGGAGDADGTDGADAASADAGSPCDDDLDCDDGLFCTGVETCDPTASGADARGCTTPGEAPCAIGQTCAEASDECRTEDCTGGAGDADGDGSRAASCGGLDCDDADPNRFPGNVEVCDSVDHDEDCEPSTYGARDTDMDDEIDARCCNVDDAGVRACGTDCDDMRAGVGPTATEACNGRDDDCDGATDEDVLTTYYVDADGDGHGTDDPTVPTTSACTAPAGHATTQDDCDDSTGSVNPGVPDVCDAAMVDDDCNGVPNDPPGGCSCTVGEPARPCEGALGICEAGNQSCIGGTWGSCSVMATTESCNGLDDDCDGSVDDGVRVTCYADGDGDGYAASGAVSTGQCPVSDRPAFGGCPVNFTNRAPLGAAEDCNDTDAAISPGALEICDARDNDCDGTPDDGVGLACYVDNDADTFASLGATPTSLCPVAGRPEYGGCPFGYTARAPSGASSADCNDVVASTRPGALEACDGVDNDCNGMIDDGMRVTCWADGDDDGYAPAGAASTMECPVSARAAVGGCPMNATNRNPATAGQADCNDGVAAIRPGAVELCDGIDNDCTGGDDAMRVTCYADADNDTYAPSGAASSMQCPDPGRTTVGLCPISFTDRSPASGADCNDSSAVVSPGATEMCQVPAFDQNCNGNVDEGYVVCYPDTDNDGFSVMGATPLAPACPLMGGYGGCATGSTSRDPSIASNRDCAPSDPARHPLAAEICNDSLDNNCNGASNEAPAVRALYTDIDLDGDGAGTTSLVPVSSCSVVPSGYSRNADDCHDRNASVYAALPSDQYGTTPYPRCTDATAMRCNVGGTWYCQVGPTCDATDPAATMSYDYDCNGAAEREFSSLGEDCGCFTTSWCAEPIGVVRCYSGSPACGALVSTGATCACAEGDAGCGDSSCGPLEDAGGSFRMGCR